MKKIIELFKSNGYELWAVGGSVRDNIIGRESHDIDFATNATPDEMLDMEAEGIKTKFFENGKAHGTILFIEDEVTYEVTTFRKDVATDGRNATIEFSKTLEEDLSRRDFTMNAIAKCMYTGELRDPHNGIEDINEKVIRFVGNPIERIAEDYLRILRGYRFLAKLGKGWRFLLPFTMGESITGTMFQKVSKERIRDELMKMFAGNPCFGLYHMPSGLRNQLIPGPPTCHHGHYHAESVETHTLIALATACRISDNPLFRLAVYLHDVGKRDFDMEDGKLTFKRHEEAGAKIVNGWMTAMKFSNEEIDYVTKLVENHMFYYPDDPKGTRRWTKRFVRKVGEEMLESFMMMRFCDSHANLANMSGEYYKINWAEHPIIKEWETIKKEEDCFKVTDLKVNGHDVMSAGCEQGQSVGIVLNSLFNMVENEEVKNEREALLEKINDILLVK